MDTKMINLAIGKLSDEIEKLKTEVKELKIQVSVLKTNKNEAFVEPQSNYPSNDSFLELSQVRKILNVSRNTILKMVKEGRLRAVRINQRTIRYAKSDVQALIKGE